MQDRSEPIPGDYSGAIAIMRHMGWSWQELLAAPEDLLDEIAMRLDRESHWSDMRRQRDRRQREAEEAKRKARRR